MVVYDHSNNVFIREQTRRGGGGMGERGVAGHGGLQAYFREIFCHENFIKTQMRNFLR